MRDEGELRVPVMSFALLLVLVLVIAPKDHDDGR